MGQGKAKRPRIQNIKIRNIFISIEIISYTYIMIRALLFSAAFLFSTHAWAACTNPAGVEGELVYNDDHNLMQYCDDVSWIGLGNSDVTTSLDNLTDTNVTPTDGQVLTWDNANSEWIAAANAGVAWQVPDDAAVCAAGTDGTIRYNSNKLQLCIDGTGWVDVGGGAAGGLWTASGNDIYTNNSGNVGIGTATPSARLEVSAVSGGPSIKLTSPTANPYLQFQNGSMFQDLGASGGLRVRSAGNAAMVFDTNGVQRMAIGGSGNVGIGTATPAAKLHVYNGTTALQSSSYWGEPAASYDALDIWSGLYSNNQDGGLSIHHQGISDFARQSFRVALKANSGGSPRGSFDLITRDASNVEQLNTEVLSMLSTGNVGIGTTSPSERLHVENNSGDSVVLSSANGDYFPRFALQRINGTTKTDYAATMAIGSTGTFNIKTGNDLSTVTDRLAITTAGNVGIGTTSPGYNLEVSNGGSASVAIDGYNGITTAGAAHWLHLNRSSNDDVAIGHDSTASVYLVRGGGNVGIGTTSPGQKLHVTGGRIVTENAEPGLIFKETDGSANENWWVSTVGGKLQFKAVNDDLASGWSDKVTLQQNGNVGIGTVNPTAMLDVYQGNLRVRRDSAQYIELQNNDSGGGYIRSHSRESNKKPLYIETVHDGGGSPLGSQQIIFRSGPASSPIENIRIDGTTGNVGIGTTSPGQKLHVTGGRIVTENAEPGLIFKETDGSANENWWVSTVGGKLQFKAVNDDLASGWSDKVTLQQNGNVGIGTATPTFKLDIAASVGGLRVLQNTSNHLVLQNYEDNDGYAGGTMALIQNSSVSASNKYLSFIADFDGDEGGAVNFGALAYGANSSFSLRNPSGNALTLQSAGGNVGVGTTNPIGRLNIAELDTGPNSAGDGASIVVGGVTTTHIEIDNNEVHAMSGNSAGTLNLNINGGNVAIGNGAFVIGGTASKPGGGSWAATSDARLKDINGTYERGLEAIAALKPVRYHYRKDNLRGEPVDKEYIGLIAQQVKPYFPEAVSVRDDGYFDLDTTSINFALINAIQELKAHNDNLKSNNEDLRDIVEKQGRDIEQLKAAIQGQ